MALIALAGLAIALRTVGIIGSEWSRLPLEWEHFIGVASALAFGLYLALIPIARFAAQYWPAPVVPLVTQHVQPSEKPDTSDWIFHDKRNLDYRFRYANPTDIPIFLSLAMSDPAIFTTFSYLSEAEWSDLYVLWQQADRQNLMVLERLDADRSAWQIVAVSIVIPLSRRGVTELWTGDIASSQIGHAQMSKSGHRPCALLLDLVAINRSALANAAEFTFTLAKLHLAQRWEYSPKRKMEIWVEPVHSKLKKILNRIGFEGPHKTDKTNGIYVLALPPVKVHLSTTQWETISSFLLSLRECAKWRIQ